MTEAGHSLGLGQWVRLTQDVSDLFSSAAGPSKEPVEKGSIGRIIYCYTSTRYRYYVVKFGDSRTEIVSEYQIQAVSPLELLAEQID